MARHNREGQGEDQHGRRYSIAYQPDWFHQAKVTRTLDNGRQSTKTLVRNPDPPSQEPGPRVRTHITSADLGLDFEVVLQDPRHVVRRVIVETVVPEGEEAGQIIAFSVSRASDDDAGTDH
ncbi:MAG TPA: hypothetical protein VFX98_06190 [Longimicrobiaceae bacterium]|nr:hypothetical protein [Longimicrobiaceae bacterium]